MIIVKTKDGNMDIDKILADLEKECAELDSKKDIVNHEMIDNLIKFHFVCKTINYFKSVKNESENNDTFFIVSMIEILNRKSYIIDKRNAHFGEKDSLTYLLDGSEGSPLLTSEDRRRMYMYEQDRENALNGKEFLNVLYCYDCDKQNLNSDILQLDTVATNFVNISAPASANSGFDLFIITDKNTKVNHKEKFNVCFVESTKFKTYNAAEEDYMESRGPVNS